MQTTINPFNILEKSTSLQKNYILEASAGTGKTFTIENMVLRLLLEHPITLEEILVVTFTKAATSELKQRIFATLSSTLNTLLKEPDEKTPPFLLSIFEEGQKNLYKAINSLRLAIASFDDAQIYTIHGFCLKMLSESSFEAHTGFQSQDTQTYLNSSRIQTLIKDFFRTELIQSHYSHSQLTKVLKAYNYDVDAMANAIERHCNLLAIMEPGPNFSQSFSQFTSAMEHFDFQGDKLLKDFLTLAPSYRKTCDRKGHILPNLLESVEKFTALFDLNQWHLKHFEMLIEQGLPYVSALDKSNLKLKAKPINQKQLFYPEALSCFRNTLPGIINQASHPNAILARMVYDTQQLLKTLTRQEELLSPDHLLLKMELATHSTAFLNSLRKRYKVAIVDEFQDTDPLQWSIFKRIFHEEKNHFLYLVGDPKQSIYSFRNADIYTYLNAKETLGKEAFATLNTNYRSHPKLVDALNTLFNESTTPKLISLPKIAKHLPYKNVASGAKDLKTLSGAHLIFLILSEKPRRGSSHPSQRSETQFLFPAITQEIVELHQKHQLALSEMVILVKDRFQADRIQSYLESSNIKARVMRTSSVADSFACEQLELLLYALFNLKNRSAVKATLGGTFFALTLDEFEQSNLESIMIKLELLRHTLIQRGFASFFQDLMLLHLDHKSHSIQEEILQQKKGIHFLSNCKQLAALITQHCEAKPICQATFLNFFDTLARRNADNDESLQIRQDQTQEAVQIMTTYASKGLEFEVVFALGIASRTYASGVFHVGDEDKLTPLIDENTDSAQNAFEELNAEKIRQLYVAMTRAKLKLYIPILFTNEDTQVPRGTMSGVELFLEKMQAYDLDSFLPDIDPSLSIEKRLLEKRIEQVTLENVITPPSIHKPPPIAIPENPCQTHSFTSLSHAYRQANPTESTPPIQISSNQLPSGCDVGNLIHKMFETISWSKLIQTQNPHHVLSLLKEVGIATPFSGKLKGWDQTIAQMLIDVVNTPLDKTGLKLCQLDNNSMLKEMEFLFPETNIPDGILSDTLKIQGPLIGGYYKGFIDLIFKFNHKYYIVDWKSNYLGSQVDDYHKDNLKHTMESRSYVLQAALYASALKRYLCLIETKPFETCFGGVFYLFVRGMQPDKGSDYGIYHLMPECNLGTRRELQNSDVIDF